MSWGCCCCLGAKSYLTLVTPGTVAHQASLSVEFHRQEYWSQLPFPSLLKIELMPFSSFLFSMVSFRISSVKYIWQRTPFLEILTQYICFSDSVVDTISESGVRLFNLLIMLIKDIGLLFITSLMVDIYLNLVQIGSFGHSFKL